MIKIQKGDIVTHKSYHSKMLFIVKNIFSTLSSNKATLESLNKNISTIAHIEDLKLIQAKYLSNNSTTMPGKILHLDGDKKYSKQAQIYYSNNNLVSIVKNIPESKQPSVVYKLLDIYSPDILIVTGHDSMIRKGINFNNLLNYKSSRFFVESVKIARTYERDKKKNLCIFAGACQSNFEAIMTAGANFASSPGRILIDFLDPLVLAKKIAFTNSKTFVTIDDIYTEIRDGKARNKRIWVLWKDEYRVFLAISPLNHG